MTEGAPKVEKTPEEIAEIKQKAQEATERNANLAEGPDGLMYDASTKTPEEVKRNNDAYLDTIGK